MKYDEIGKKYNLRIAETITIDLAFQTGKPPGNGWYLTIGTHGEIASCYYNGVDFLLPNIVVADRDTTWRMNDVIVITNIIGWTKGV